MGITDYLKVLTQETEHSETEVMARALEAGLRQLWRDHLIGSYLRGNATREATAELVGIDWIELAERQHKAVQEDLEWALGE